MKPSFADIRRKLRIVVACEDDYDLSDFPTFLIIGPQRTGTTWLHKNLAKHPQVLMPRKKEIYYFNNLRSAQHHPSGLPRVEPDLGWYLSHFRLSWGERRLRDRLCRWRFGVPFDPRTIGEATATYAAGLDRAAIEDIATLNPNIKVITMVRDPIDRAWSHAKKDLAKFQRRRVGAIPDWEWIDFFRTKYQVACGDYGRFHALWRTIIPSANFFVGRFIDLTHDPIGVLRTVFDFLGIDVDPRYIVRSAAKPVNSTSRAAIPPHLHRVLDDLFGKEAERLLTAGLI